MTASSRARPSLSQLIIALIFVGSGILHFVAPDRYARVVPPWLPMPMLLVQISGVAELLGGIGVLIPQTRVAAGWGLIALLVAVFPANIQVLIAAHAAHASLMEQSLLVLRLPLQPLLIWWVWRVAVKGRA